ncbi:MAG: type II secretion system protein, partial [Acidobacteria bacterium]|nr:type II secretion system protein [Acidobacteriota bacterium]
MSSDHRCRIRRSRQSGFSFLELLVVVALMTIIMGVVFNYLIIVQQRYKTEESRLDVAQESREFID